MTAVEYEAVLTFLDEHLAGLRDGRPVGAAALSGLIEVCDVIREAWRRDEAATEPTTEITSLGGTA